MNSDLITDGEDWCSCEAYQTSSQIDQSLICFDGCNIIDNSGDTSGDWDQDSGGRHPFWLLNEENGGCYSTNDTHGLGEKSHKLDCFLVSQAVWIENESIDSQIEEKEQYRTTVAESSPQVLLMVQTDLQLGHHADFLATLDNFIGIVMCTIRQEGCCGIFVVWHFH